MQIKAIETRYKGYRFRSRLEARWAVFFDALGIKWEYEKEGYDLGDAGYYLPDFWLPHVQMWAEVKSGLFSYDELKKANALFLFTKHECILLDGMPGFRSYFIAGYGGWNDQYMNEAGYISGRYSANDYNVALPWNDVIIYNGKHYQGERRFYSNTGNQDYPEPMQWKDQADSDDYCAAVNAARAARFEHGEGR